MLDKGIPSADRRQYTAVKDPCDWRNPFLLLNNDGSITVITDGGKEQIIKAEVLKELLVGLPISEWPFGKVVSIRPCSIRSEDKAKFEEEDKLLKASWGILRDVMRGLGLEMNMWPSGESSRDVVKRDSQPQVASRAANIKMPDRAEIDKFMREAINEAKKGLADGGIPIGSVLVRNGEIVARGHNHRTQNGDPTAHAEIECLRNAGRQRTFKDTILYSTLMPCSMCGGTAIQFKIPVVIAGEDRTFPSSRKWMEASGIRVIDLNMDECYNMLKQFAEQYPDVWKEDIGELD